MILRIIITVLVYGLLGWLFCDIDPNKTYYWYSGIWHGLFFFINWIRHFFWDCEFKAVHFTAAYKSSIGSSASSPSSDSSSEAHGEANENNKHLKAYVTMVWNAESFRLRRWTALCTHM